MFECYVEQARRVIFFARYEASQLGSPYIETEHLLLGLLREDGRIKSRLGEAAVAQIRKQIETQIPSHPPTSTTVDLPLSHDAKHVLHLSAEAAEELGDHHIYPEHLLIGLLRLAGGFAAQLLQPYGLDERAARDLLRQARHEQPDSGSVPEPEPEEDPIPPGAPLAATMDALRNLLDQSRRNLRFDEPYALQRLKRQPWTRKEALGRLIDLATTHHHWLTRALTEHKLSAGGYPPTESVTAQHYNDARWDDLVEAWLAINRILIHAMRSIDEAAAQKPCRIGLAGPVPLKQLMETYFQNCYDLMSQILGHLG